MEPSKQQLAVLDFVCNDHRSCVVEARAGSGKTTTLVMLANELPKNRLCLFLAFNKNIATELQERLPAHIQAKTFHSHCFGALQRNLPRRPRVDENKVFNILKDSLSRKDFDIYFKYVCRLVGYAKAYGIGTNLASDEPAEWYRLIDHFSMVADSGDFDEVRAIELAQDTLKASNDNVTVIDFDDMLYLALLRNVTFDKCNFVMLDEAQDTNGVQRALLHRMLAPNGRLIAVGDTFQCQPVGTLVSVVGSPGNRWNKAVIEQKPIETVSIGDRVISYSVTDHSFIMGGRLVLDKREREFNDDLVVVTAHNGKTSSYTPNHKCFVNFSPLRELFAIYLMQRGNQFRVGKAKMDYGSEIGSGPIVRMRAEKADAIWILTVCATEDEVRDTEQVISGMFGLTQLLFKVSNVSTITQARLDETWSAIGDNTTQATKCLNFYGRKLEYPLHTKLEDRGFMSLKRPMVIHACNLITGCMVLPFTGDAHSTKQEWVAVTISNRSFTGKVYSLQVEREELYVADGIVTHNSIYGFRGADADAMSALKQEFNAVEFPLSVSYRCAQEVVAETRREIPDSIDAHPTAPIGSVERLNDYDLDNFDSTSAILCRVTAPLVTLAFGFIRRNVGVRILGREIGAGLVALVKKMNTRDVDVLSDKLSNWRTREVGKALARGHESAAAAIDDKFSCLMVFIDQLDEDSRSVNELVRRIESLFSDNNRGLLTLCSVHKAKGLEWPTVFILDREEYMPSRWAKQEWQRKQETNLIYVAITRAKLHLRYIKSDQWRKAKSEPQVEDVEAKRKQLLETI